MKVHDCLTTIKVGDTAPWLQRLIADPGQPATAYSSRRQINDNMKHPKTLHDGFWDGMEGEMTREAIKKRLAGIRERKAKILELEAKYEGLELEADEAASFKIIHKEKIQPEDLEFLVSLSDEEIRTILGMRSPGGEPQEGAEADETEAANDVNDYSAEAALSGDGADEQEKREG